MDKSDFQRYYSTLVPANYLNIALDAKSCRDKQIRILLEKKKLPEEGWPDITIEHLVNELKLLDSNNFPYKCGVGEREARIVCDLVAKRHYNFGHGVGRSGDLVEAQPKAVGSSMISNLTNILLLDLIRAMGIPSAKKCVLVPMATGMTMMLTLVSLRESRKNAKYVLWSRIDQKSCFKSIVMAGFIPVIIDTILPSYADNGSELENKPGTDIEAFSTQIEQLGAENIVCIISTTSCFAPRCPDDVFSLAVLAKTSNIPHIVNNAYGLQIKHYCREIERANRSGRIDAFIQSTDKNLMVPVGGAIVAAFDETAINNITKVYPGRASFSQTLDVFMTLLSLGRNGYLKLVKEREEMFRYLQSKLRNVAEERGEILLDSKKNLISIAFSLQQRDNYTEIGSKLYTRGVSGCRVVSTQEVKTVDGYVFQKWGSHSNNSSIPYLTASASMGITQEEIDVFATKLDNVLSKK